MYVHALLYLDGVGFVEKFPKAGPAVFVGEDIGGEWKPHHLLASSPHTLSSSGACGGLLHFVIHAMSVLTRHYIAIDLITYCFSSLWGYSARKVNG